jgi:hypothetical protein
MTGGLITGGPTASGPTSGGHGPEGWAPLRDPSGPRQFKLPTTPFGRLGVAHGLVTAADAMVTLALAGSLFFSLSVDAAKSKVLLYLILSLAPFAIVAPLIGPWIDRFSGGRRWVIIGSCLLRAVLALVMAGNLNSLLLFPLAFAILVVSKTYSVARSSLVPEVVRGELQLMTANSRLALIAGLAAIAGQIPALAVRFIGGEDWVLRLAAVAFLACAAASFRIVTLGHLTDHRGDQRSDDSASGSHPLQPGELSDGPDHSLSPAVQVAVTVMAIMRGQVGLLLFLVLFSFRRDDVATGWYAAVGVAAAAFTAIGAALSPKLRERVREDVILAAMPVVGGFAALLCSVQSSPLLTVVLGAAIGLASSAGRVALDAVLQRDVRSERRSAEFGRVETLFQLVWVAGALLPVAIDLPRWLGALVIAMSSAAAVAIGVIGEPALRWVAGQAKGLRPTWWKKPIRPEPDVVDNAWAEDTRWTDDTRSQ